MRQPVVFLSSLLLAAGALAQNAPVQSANIQNAPASAAQPVPNTPTVLVAPPRSQACPVDLFAQRHSGLEAQRIADATSDQPGSRLEIFFRRLDSPAILNVSGIAHGPDLGGHLDPASTDHPADLSEPFHLRRASHSASLDRSELRPHLLGNTRWLELTRIDFADGSHWQPSPGSTCRATPNGFLLL